MSTAPKAIGIIAPQLSGDYFGTLFKGIHTATRRYSPRLIAIQASPAEVVQSQLAKDEVDGWIVINNADGIEQLAAWGVPLISIGVQVDGLNCPAVFPDNHSGMRDAVAHLIDHGHQRIAFIGELGHHDVRQRYEGYQAALAARNLACDPALTFSIPSGSEHHAAAALQRLLDAQLDCTAVAVATDEGALGVLPTALAAGKRVPEDLAVVSFDDIILAHGLTPPLTTVRLPIQALGSTAAELLLDRIGGREVPSLSYVPTALIRRRSCGCSISLASLAPDTLTEPQSWQAALAPQLMQLAIYPLPAPPHATLSAIWPGGAQLIQALEAAIDGSAPIGVEVLAQAWQQVVGSTQSLDALLTILALIEQAGAQQIAAAPEDRGRRARLEALYAQLRMELLQARLSPETNAIHSYASLVHQAYAINRALLRAQYGEAQQLAWLAATPLSWACLGLWEESSRAAPTLIAAGSYHHASQGAASTAPGSHYQAAHFPPEQLLPATVRESGDEIVLLLPLNTPTQRMGVLALASSIQYLASSGNYDVLSAITSLLTAALERDTLQRTLHEAYERERGLANIVRELGCPVIPLIKEVLLVPLIGVIDTMRAQQIMEAILEGVSSHKATNVLLDISSVPLVDTQVANSLIQAARAASLLGAQVTLVGVRPEIAQSIVGLGIAFPQLATQPTLAAALQMLISTRAQQRGDGAQAQILRAG